MKNQKKVQLLDIVPIFILVIIFAFFAIASKGTTLSAYNLQLICTQVVPVIIGSLGCIFVISLGGTDISIGANAAMCSTVATLATAGIGGWAAIPLTLVLSTALGALIGFIVTKFRVASFMTTLAVLIAGRGFLNFLLQNNNIGAPKGIQFLTTFWFTVLLLVILIAVVWYIFEYTKFGFYCKCIGENERTVRSVGINVNRIRLICFMIAGLAAGIVGIVQICRVGGSTNTLCNMLEMRVQMAIFLGGILTTGGFTAKIYKLIIGSFTIVIIENGLTLCKVSSALSEAIEGILLVVILIITVYCSRIAMKRDLAMAAQADQESVEA
ncbi:MAG: ABC transporter permease [Lachnospiraceae bacterium]|nr:ABC transporter permease [Lachnospiraceae bacterium]